MKASVLVVAAMVLVLSSALHADMVTFDDAGWTTGNGYPYPDTPRFFDSDGKTILHLSFADYHSRKSTFFATAQNITGFDASFVWYSGSRRNENPGDGFTFVVQNAGLYALGADGGGLGYQGIGSSTGIAFNMMNQSIALVSDGSIGAYSPIANPVDMDQFNSYSFTLHYDGHTLSTSIENTYSHEVFNIDYVIDIPLAVGDDTALIGFTSGSGAAWTSQYVQDFSFESISLVPEPASTVLALSGILSFLGMHRLKRRERKSVRISIDN